MWSIFEFQRRSCVPLQIGLKFKSRVANAYSNIQVLLWQPAVLILHIQRIELMGHGLLKRRREGRAPVSKTGLRS